MADRREDLRGVDRRSRRDGARRRRERARLADRLARSEERYRTFVSLSTEGILRVDAPPVSLEAPVEEQVAHIRRHGVVAEANASLAKLLGAASPQPLIGRTLESLVRSDAAEKVLTEWIRAGYRFSEYEIDLVGVDGATLWLLGSMIGVTTDGQLVALWSTWRNITRRKEAVQALEFQARHDPLTGLPNRKWLAERLGAALEISRQTGEGLALMMMDLDHFKEINDSLGHFAGDQLLKLIGPRLQPLLERRGAELARLGGDEFAVIVNRCGDAGAATRSRTRSSRACASRSRWEASGSASTRRSARPSRRRTASTPRR